MQGARVLVVADYAPLQRMVAQVLSEAGCEVVTAGGSREALEVIARRSFDLILANNLMPEMDGKQMARRVRERARNVPIVLMTGDEALLHAGRLPPAVDFLLAKPFDADGLLGVAARALAARPDVPARAPRDERPAILVVDDEPEVLLFLRQALEMEGYVVLDASRGAAALDLSRAYPGTIPLLITDVVMPGMSGPELVNQLLQARPGTKVLYISGFAGTTLAKGRSMAFVQKPFTVEGLVRVVSDLLARP